jgi:hypothetical protein
VRLFDPAHAQHFCSTPVVVGSGVHQSLRTLHGGLTAQSFLDEGTAAFDLHRANLLAASERWMLYSTSLYRRSIEMLVPVSAPWAHVTLYYASFFSANAILAMHGGWVSSVKNKTTLVDVERGTPTSQRLKIHRGKSATSPNGASGSHRIFWDHYYGATPNLTAWVPTNLTGAFQPVNGTYSWQTDARNEINYDMHCAWESSKQLRATFRTTKLKSVSGPLALQLEACELLTRTAKHFAARYGLEGNSLGNCGFNGDRTSIIRGLAKQRPPALLNQSFFEELIA